MVPHAILLIRGDQGFAMNCGPLHVLLSFSRHFAIAFDLRFLTVSGHRLGAMFVGRAGAQTWSSFRAFPASVDT
jgi:hypothetical protein